MNIPEKLISFSLFGTDPKYRQGMMLNIKTLKSIFNIGWHIVIYCDRINYAALNQEKINDKVKVILQEEISKGTEGMSWRLDATLLPGVKVVLFRDCDSVFTEREAEAVNEWLRSTHDTHIIRDHPWHQSPVMGGTLGVRGKSLDFLAKLVRERLQTHRRTEYGDDQIFLSHYFYPKARSNALIHTNCVRYFPERTRPMPPDRLDEDFVGAYVFATPEERLKFEAIREVEAPRTLLPTHWEKNRWLRKIYQQYAPIRRIRHGCQWCL